MFPFFGKSLRELPDVVLYHLLERLVVCYTPGTQTDSSPASSSRYSAPHRPIQRLVNLLKTKKVHLKRTRRRDRDFFFAQFVCFSSLFLRRVKLFMMVGELLLVLVTSSVTVTDTIHKKKKKKNFTSKSLMFSLPFVIC